MDKPYFAKGNLRWRSIHRQRFNFNFIAGSYREISGRHLRQNPSTGKDHIKELLPLVFLPRIRRHRRQFGLRFKQRWHHDVRSIRLELLPGFFKKLVQPFSTGYAIPGDINSVEDRLGSRIALEVLEVLDHPTAPGRAPKRLVLGYAYALRCHLSVGHAE